MEVKSYIYILTTCSSIFDISIDLTLVNYSISIDLILELCSAELSFLMLPPVIRIGLYLHQSMTYGVRYWTLPRFQHNSS